MSDIVERLHARKGFWLNGGAWMMGTGPDADCQEAATEIERLQRELQAVLGHVKDLRIENAQLKLELRKALQDDQQLPPGVYPRGGPVPKPSRHPASSSVPT